MAESFNDVAKGNTAQHQQPSRTGRASTPPRQRSRPASVASQDPGAQYMQDDGFDQDGFDNDGFDRNGFDRDGLDRDGLDHNGRSRGGSSPASQRSGGSSFRAEPRPSPGYGGPLQPRAGPARSAASQSGSVMSRKDERAAKLDKARSYLEKTGSLSRGPSARRPVTPTRSAQESQAVANFKATRPTTPEASSGGLGATRRLSPARSSMRSVTGKSQAFVRAKKLLDDSRANRASRATNMTATVSAGSAGRRLTPTRSVARSQAGRAATPPRRSRPTGGDE